MAELRLEVSDHIAVITLDNPPLNLWNVEWDEQLEDMFDSFDTRDDVRVAVITGAGERAFTAGADHRYTGPPPRRRAVRNYLQALIDCSVPVIGAINGHALGHGLAIASQCDFLIGSENARFGLPEIRTGGANGGRFFMRLFPVGFARYAVYTGESIDAHEAYRLGALLKLTTPAELMPEAMRIAAVIAGQAPLAVRAFKDSLRWVEDMDVQRGYEFENELHRKLYTGTPAGQAQRQEALNSFFEKRKADFSGLE
jgi:enoyl-CoA hydratase